MTRHIWQVFTYELKRNIRRRGFLFTTFGIPIIGFIVILGYQAINARNASAEGASATPVQTQGPQFDGVRKAGYIDLSGQFSDPGDTSAYLVRYDDESAAAAAMSAGDIDVYYIIPADYLETGDVTLVAPKFSLNLVTDAPIRQLILGHLAANVEDRDRFNRLVNPTNLDEINLQRDTTGQTKSSFDVDFLVVYIFAIALMMSVFLTNGYLMQTVIEEKETRLIEILISTMRPTQLLTGKIFALGLLGLIQIVVWVGSLFLLGRLVAGDAASPTGPPGSPYGVSGSQMSSGPRDGQSDPTPHPSTEEVACDAWC